MGTVPLIQKTLLIGVGIYVTLFGLHVTMHVNPWVHIVLSAVGSAFISIGSMMQWGLVGETIGYNEYILGKRTEGTIYGTFNMIRRLGQAIGSSGSVALLGLIGYDVALSNMGQAQSPETLLGIKMFCVLAPAIVSLGSWVALRFVWNITPEVKVKMHANT